MSGFKSGAVRLMFPVIVRSDIPGRLRLGVKNFSLIPKDAAHLSVNYVGKVFGMLDGVLAAEVNPMIGSLLIRYDPCRIDAKTILGWIDTMIDVGVQHAPAIARSGVRDPLKIEAFFMEKLQRRLPQPAEDR